MGTSSFKYAHNPEELIKRSSSRNSDIKNIIAPGSTNKNIININLTKDAVILVDNSEENHLSIPLDQASLKNKNFCVSVSSTAISNETKIVKFSNKVKYFKLTNNFQNSSLLNTSQSTKIYENQDLLKLSSRNPNSDNNRKIKIELKEAISEVYIGTNLNNWKMEKMNYDSVNSTHFIDIVYFFNLDPP